MIRKYPANWTQMSIVPLEQISLCNLEGKRMSLRELTRDGLLLIFLRHLA